MRARLVDRLRRESGFTLIELLTAMIFLGVMFAVFELVVSSTVRHSDAVQKQSDLQAEVRAGVDRFTQEFRQAYTGDSTPVVESISSTGLTFYSPDRATPFHLRKLSYRVSASQLERAFAGSSDTDGPPWVIPGLGAWQPLVSAIVNPVVFTYLDENGASTGDPAAVRTVNVSLTLEPPALNGRRFSYSTSVTIRSQEA